MSDATQSPVRALRDALAKAEGKPITQQQMAERLGAAFISVRRWEQSGSLPQQRAVLSNYKKLARKVSVEFMEMPAAKPTSTSREFKAIQQDGVK